MVATVTIHIGTEKRDLCELSPLGFGHANIQFPGEWNGMYVLLLVSGPAIEDWHTWERVWRYLWLRVRLLLQLNRRYLSCLAYY